MTKIVLLGAGASFGANKTNKPPLGNQLFNNLVKRGGIASRLSESLVDEFIQNFEKGMEKYENESDIGTMTFQRELAQYLAEFSPEEDCIYIKLLKRLVNLKIQYVSLNYDLMLEISAGIINKGIHYDNVINKGNISLLKIHGSSNFWPKMNDASVKGITFIKNKVDINVEIETLTQDSTLDRCKNDKNLAPAIAHYAVGKQVKISANFITEQQNMWKQSVDKSKKIVIIGVAINDLDKHIWKVIGESKARVLYVGCTDDDRKNFNAWKRNHEKANAFYYESKFENCLAKVKRELEDVN